MELEHSFTVPVGIDEAWRVLTDIEQVAPCMPGAALDSVDGDDFTGTVKVKLGPITVTYKGKARFAEKDEAAHRAVIEATGRDSRGNGTAAATVRAVLSTVRSSAGGDGTKVDVVTDLDITGKPAQFGRGVLEDISNRLIGQFSDCLADKLTNAAAGAPAGAPESSTEPTSEPAAAAPAEPVAASSRVLAPIRARRRKRVTPTRPVSNTPATRHSAQDVKPVNLLSTAGPAVAKRAAPVAAGLVVVLLVIFGLRRRKG